MLSVSFAADPVINALYMPRRFDGLESHGVRYEREEWLGDGDSCCKLSVTTNAT